MPREAGRDTALLPKNDPLPFLLTIIHLLVNLSGALSTAINISQMGMLSYVLTVGIKLDYKVSITTVGIKQINYYYIMVRKTDSTTKFLYLYLHLSLELHLHLILFRIIVG